MAKLEYSKASQVELPHPIPSRRLRRITFVLTNGKRLNEAWEINDLFLGPREQDLAGIPAPDVCRLANGTWL